MVLGIDYSNTLSSAIMHVNMGCYDVCTVYMYVLYICIHVSMGCYDVRTVCTCVRMYPWIVCHVHMG